MMIDFGHWKRSAMAAYASLLSLGHLLDQILQHPSRQMVLFDKAQIDSLLEEVIFLRDFLEESSLKKVDEVQALERKIVCSACAAEDIIESRVVDGILGDSEADSERSSTLFIQDLQQVIEEIASIKEDVVKIKETDKGIKIMEQPRKDVTSGPFIRGASNSKSTMVGFDGDLIQILETLTGDESNLQILSVVGMGGIGKTTLARNVFGSPSTVHHFDVKAWVTISQQYSVHGILLGLLKVIGALAGEGEEIIRKNAGELGLLLHRSLFDRRYFIVMDDIWTTEVWDGIKRFFPDNNNGSRILATTRLSNVADNFQSCNPHRLNFLDEDNSWTLFVDKVFGQESCPPELVELGKTIVRNCRGLPLAIVAIGGLLSKASGKVEDWENVANDTFTAVNMGDNGHCYEILSLSYKYLPVHLKPCFLYMAIFPEDSEISISRLLRVWVAEGILKPMRSGSLEETAEDNLKDLVDRNLILVQDYGSINRIKTCTIHDLIRDLCLMEAQKEKFLYVGTHGIKKHPHVQENKKIKLNNHPRSMVDMRRLIIHQCSKEDEWQQQVLYAMDSASCTRSLICNTFKFTSTAKLPNSLRLLRVLNMDDACSYEEILRLVNSRYIAFRVPLFPYLHNPLESLSLLWNLQTIYIDDTTSNMSIELPAAVWDMPHLRHVEKEGGFSLPDPPSIQSNGKEDFSVLRNLQTLYKITDFRCTDEVLRRIPNIKKLGVSYSNFGRGNGWQYHEVNKFVHLRNLESLFLHCNKDVLQNFCLPHSLKKLTMSHCRVPWEDLTVIGLLPHLEVLKLRDYAVQGREWKPVGGGFLQLKSLQIESTDLEEWIADSSHFPRLEHLLLRQVMDLKEIPYGIGEIPTLRSISLEGCSDSVNSSANEIQEEQQNLGNDDFRVLVQAWGNMKLLKQAFEGKRLFSRFKI